jgi:hypothetical protein
MQIPGSASDPMQAKQMPDVDEAYIMNPYAGKELLTLVEAYDLLSAVASELYADGIHRYGKG